MQFLKQHYQKLIVLLILISIIVIRNLQYIISNAGIISEIDYIVNDFLTIVIGITVEALPFLTLGVIVSVIVEMLPSKYILGLVPKNKVLSHLILPLFGIFMPVCECGNVPVARRLMLSGFNLSHSVSFLLAAPIINPITYYATISAFNFEPQLAIFRIVGAYIIAVIVGSILSFYSNQDSLIQPNFKEEIIACMHDHDHQHFHPLETFRTEFISTLKMLIIGSCIAGLTQTIIPRSIIENIGSSAFLSIISMLVLAFVVSICANVDAFFALAYARTFTMGSILTFLVFGPMIDIKMLTMLKESFKPKLLIYITFMVTILSILMGVIYNFIYE